MTDVQPIFVPSACYGLAPVWQLPEPWPPGGIIPISTIVTANFTLPAVNATGTVQVETTEGIKAGDIVWLDPVGFVNVVSVNGPTSMTVRNGDYDENDVPGTVVLAGAGAMVAGPRGPMGLQGPKGELSECGCVHRRKAQVSLINCALLACSALSK